ncbi:Tye7p Ecym_5051 [Eremothecium cymbalariae DBVPG|uniref:BHLH domain-containing protein n=1 Tax=Eremothecium cymbalariae (strain CBS 270.75 / DBVPG 7215 / KCTC 17166 / NRRL Y-17582) TaxID=931890 RepID=I6NCQ0_ERECY|nr:hypothetical protein Ecym_5051 [Eremothecium cymbalariae DBVPG\
MSNAGPTSFEEWLMHERVGTVKQPGQQEEDRPKWYESGQSAPSSVTTSSAGSPVDQFASLFDANATLGQQSDSETLFATSNETSLMNSPTLVKKEQAEADLQFISELVSMALDFGSLEDGQTPANADAAAAKQNTVQQRKPSNEHSNDHHDDDYSSNDDKNDNDNEWGNNKTSTVTPRKERTAAQSKRKRGPRKRLTPHQKEAHNKIEKRYRININTKIAKLQQIIPWVASEETAFEVGDDLRPKITPSCMNVRGSSAAAAAAAAAGTPKLNKSMILEKAVDYILYLQNNQTLYELEVQRLKKELETFRSHC